MPVSKSYVRERGVDTHRSVENIKRMLALSIVRCQSCRLLLISTTKCVNLLYCTANAYFLLQKPCVYCRPSSAPFQSAGLGRTFSLKHFLVRGCYFPLCYFPHAFPFLFTPVYCFCFQRILFLFLFFLHSGDGVEAEI